MQQLYATILLREEEQQGSRRPAPDAILFSVAREAEQQPARALPPLPDPLLSVSLSLSLLPDRWSQG